MTTGLDDYEHIHNKHSVTSISATIVHVNYIIYQHVQELIHNDEVTAIMDNMDGIFKLIDWKNITCNNNLYF